MKTGLEGLKVVRRHLDGTTEEVDEPGDLPPRQKSQLLTLLASWAVRLAVAGLVSRVDPEAGAELMDRLYAEVMELK